MLSVNHCGLLSYEPDGKMTMSVLNNMRLHDVDIRQNDQKLKTDEHDVDLFYFSTTLREFITRKLHCKYLNIYLKRMNR